MTPCDDNSNDDENDDDDAVQRGASLHLIDK